MSEARRQILLRTTGTSRRWSKTRTLHAFSTVSLAGRSATNGATRERPREETGGLQGTEHLHGRRRWIEKPSFQTFFTTHKSTARNELPRNDEQHHRNEFGFCRPGLTTHTWPCSSSKSSASPTIARTHLAQTPRTAGGTLLWGTLRVMSTEPTSS